MDIVFCTDHGYVMPYGVLLKSICYNNVSAINFHIIITPSVSEEDKNRLKSIALSGKGNTVSFYLPTDEVIKKLESLPDIGPKHVSITTYYKLFLGEILPQSISKVLYLDGDMIVRKPLDNLWNMDVSSVSIAYVIDQSYTNIKWFNYLKYPSTLGYYNTGMFIANLDIWRRNNISAKFVDFAISFPERLLCREQDVMNYVLRNEKMELPITYNFQSGFLYDKGCMLIEYMKYEDQIEEYKSDPCVVHYLTSDKPWVKGSKHPYLSEFFKYRNMTVWKDEPLIKARPRYGVIADRFLRVARKLHLFPPKKRVYDIKNENPLKK